MTKNLPCFPKGSSMKSEIAMELVAGCKSYHLTTRMFLPKLLQVLLSQLIN